VGTGLRAGYGHGGAEGWGQRDVKRDVKTWRMRLDGEHQAMGEGRWDGIEGNRVWGAREAKERIVDGRSQGARAYGKGQEGDDGDTGETKRKKVAGAGEGNEL